MQVTHASKRVKAPTSCTVKLGVKPGDNALDGIASKPRFWTNA